MWRDLRELLFFRIDKKKERVYLCSERLNKLGRSRTTDETFFFMTETLSLNDGNLFLNVVMEHGLRMD